MNITIYSTTTCATCHLVTSWLEKQNQDYVKRDTDVDPEAMEAFMGVNDGMIGVPFTVITNDAGVQTKISGFDQKKFREALGI